MTLCWLVDQMTHVEDSGEITFQAVRARETSTALISLISTFLLGQSADWEVWAVAPDGRRFMVRDHLDEGTADYVAHAFDGEVREAGSPEEWAKAKGFDALARHLRSGLR